MATQPLSAGDLDQQVTLLTRIVGTDSRGQSVVPGWRDSVTVAARARPVTAREAFRDGSMQALGSVVFSIRYRAGLQATGAVRWRGRVYELMAEPVNVDGANHTLELITGTLPT